MHNTQGVLGNSHAHHYRKCAHRVPSATLNLWSVPHCASAVLPVVHIPQRTLSIWQVLAMQRSLSLWVKCSQLWQCRREVNARIDVVFKDFHLQWKIEYKSGFIGNNYKKVVYLGEEVYDTPACSLIYEFERALEGDSCN